MEETRQEESIADEVEFVNGCPVCEHADPELERLLEEFARWLYEVMRIDQDKKRMADEESRIDKRD